MIQIAVLLYNEELEWSVVFSEYPYGQFASLPNDEDTLHTEHGTTTSKFQCAYDHPVHFSPGCDPDCQHRLLDGRVRSQRSPGDCTVVFKIKISD